MTTSAESSPSASIHDLFKPDLAGFCVSAGFPAYRADQVWRWLYRQWVSDWDAMRNVPAALRAALAERFRLDAATLTDAAVDAGGTRKVLVALRDGERVEAVLLPARGRRTVCISCQVGCRFACTFCASGQAGFRRQLSPGEMVGQVLVAARLLRERPSHVVFMGMGEPLDNVDAVLRAARILNDPDGLSIGARRITISTCGVIPGIERLAGEGPQFELSVSLHAPDDALRSRLMPVNKRYPLAELLAACGAYARRTGRIVTFEYTLIRGVNDRPEQAAALARLLAPLPCRVNLIPLSEVAEFTAVSAPAETADAFVAELARHGVNATLRRSKGSAVQAACGQLRYRAP